MGQGRVARSTSPRAGSRWLQVGAPNSAGPAVVALFIPPPPAAMAPSTEDAAKSKL